MTWFICSVVAMLCWSGSDLFSKIGCVDKRDKYSHLKMVTAVGIVMGIHAFYEIGTGGAHVTTEVILTYLPVSALYIASMTIGYLGLRYLELSITSPICNSSGAIVAILTIAMGVGGSLGGLQIMALVFVCGGVVGLGIVEMTEDEHLRMMRQQEGKILYTKSLIAIMIPVIYCLLDALGTFADSIVLEKLDENSANAAYELTFLIVGAVCAFYVLVIKKERIIPKQSSPRFLGAICETIGQFFYIYALADRSHVMFSAPIISGYCIVSVVWSRIFLKEKLSFKHYLMIGIAVVGIIILGVYDEA